MEAKLVRTKIRLVIYIVLPFLILPLILIFFGRVPMNILGPIVSSHFDVPLISIAEFGELQGQKPYRLLDIREKEEYEVSRIKGAIHVGYKDIDIKAVANQLKKDEVIIVYCSVGYRSGEIGEKLGELGFDVRNLRGGIFNWVNEGFSVVDQSGITKKVHPYNSFWSRFLKKSPQNSPAL